MRIIKDEFAAGRGLALREIFDYGPNAHLEVDVKGLAGWSSLQSPAWQEHFLAALSPSLQNALRASMAFRSRADQLNAARKGQAELVASVKKLVTQGKVTFSEIVA